MSKGNGWKNEWILMGLTALFLCALLALFLHDRQELRSQTVAVQTEVPQEALLPDLSPLDLNLASAEELQTLPGVGEELAARIVAYREEHGSFESVEQIMEVPGIGEGKFAGMDGWITVNSEDTE